MFTFQLDDFQSVQPSFSYQCIGLYVTALLDRGYQSEMKALTATTLYGSLGLPYLSVCREIRGLFFRSYRKGSYPRPHRSERSQSSVWAVFLSSEGSRLCVSNYVRHAIFNPKLMSETVK